MLKRYRLLILLIILIPATAFSVRQGSLHGKWWQMPRMARKIGLTEIEVEKLDNLYRASRRNLIHLKADVEAEQFDLETLIEDKELNEAAALEKYRNLEKAKATLGMERFRFLLDVRKLLGHKRFRTLMKLGKLRKEKNGIRQEETR